MIDPDDISVIHTCLREMKEEIGFDQDKVQVLGVLRCDWSKLEVLAGVSVTPVLGYIGEIKPASMPINPDEVDHCFTVPLETLLNRSNWTEREFSAPVFRHGDHIIWGLTGYILNDTLRNIIEPIR